MTDEIPGDRLTELTTSVVPAPFSERFGVPGEHIRHGLCACKTESSQTYSLRIALTAAFEKGADVIDELILNARLSVDENMQIGRLCEKIIVYA